MTRHTLTALAALTLTALAACSTPATAHEAVDNCTDSPFITVGSDRSVSMTTTGDESPGADLIDVVCVLDALDAPPAVLMRMDQTRALDGMQTANWGRWTAHWTYHPADGMTVTVEQ